MLWDIRRIILRPGIQGHIDDNMKLIFRVLEFITNKFVESEIRIVQGEESTNIYLALQIAR